MKDERSLLDLAMEILHKRKYSNNTKESYSDWIYRFVFFHNKKLPSQFGRKEIVDFLSFLKTECKYAPTTINVAYNAIAFLYKEVLNISCSGFCLHPYYKSRSPVILNREEIKSILLNLQDEQWLMASLLYGSGLCVSECVRLRVRSIDFSMRKITVRSNEQNEPRTTLLPRALDSKLIDHIKKLKSHYENNLKIKKFAGTLKNDISEQDTALSKDFEWYYIFPSERLRVHESSGKLVLHSRSESYFQKAIKQSAKKVGIRKNVTCHSFRHSFATHLLECGYDIHIIQKLLGHKDIRTTMVYNQLKNKTTPLIESPLDKILNH